MEAYAIPFTLLSYFSIVISLKKGQRNIDDYIYGS